MGKHSIERHIDWVHRIAEHLSEFGVDRLLDGSVIINYDTVMAMAAELERVSKRLKVSANEAATEGEDL
jgi:hypothetical protein